MSARRGAGSLGCLTTMLVIAAVAYFGVPVGEAYIRYFRFRDAMHQELRFAGNTSDAAIRRHLRAFADSIGLPADARAVYVRRSGREIAISSRYSEVIALPMRTRELRFVVRAKGAF